jgi:hypothetical protein
MLCACISMAYWPSWKLRRRTRSLARLAHRSIIRSILLCAATRRMFATPLRTAGMTE